MQLKEIYSMNSYSTLTSKFFHCLWKCQASAKFSSPYSEDSFYLAENDKKKKVKIHQLPRNRVIHWKKNSASYMYIQFTVIIHC